MSMRSRLSVLLWALVLVLVATNVTAADIDITIGIKDPGFARSDPKSGHWRGVAHKDAWNGSYYHDNQYDQPDLYGTWTPTITVPGKYNVYMRWVAHPNRSSAAQVHIVHKDGVTEVQVDQRQNGAQWNLLGQFEFEAGTAGYVRLFSAPGYTIFEAVRFELVGAPAIPAGIDLDVSHPEFTTTGEWRLRETTAGERFLEAAGDADYHAATWGIPADLAAGEYEVYVYHTPGENRPQAAEVHVKFDLGLDTARWVDQTEAGWEKIGRYYFTPGYNQSVSLVYHGSERLAATKLRFVLIKPFPFRVLYPEHVAFDADGAGSLQRSHPGDNTTR